LINTSNFTNNGDNVNGLLAIPQLLSSSYISRSNYLSVYSYEVIVSDNSRGSCNPHERKKGGSKICLFSFSLGSAEYEILSKIDARKSFSNPSFKQYYNRGQYTLIPFEADFSIVCEIQETKRGREDKFFVGLRNCEISNNSNRHPLLALSASTSYTITIATNIPKPHSLIFHTQAKWQDGETIVNQIISDSNPNINNDIHSISNTTTKGNNRKRLRGDQINTNFPHSKRISVSL